MKQNDSSSRFYNGNPNVKAEGAQQNYTIEQIKNIQLYMNDPSAFINDCVKVVSIDKGIVPFHLYPYQKRIIDAVNNNRFTICKLFRQAGKLLPLDQLIPTPSGFKQLRDIHVGDYVFDATGKPTAVVSESELQNPLMYRITFDTGETIECCCDHQWSVYDRRLRKSVVMTTKQLIESRFVTTHNNSCRYRFCIINTKPIDIDDHDIKIDPYLFGLWLGCGVERTCALSYHYKHHDRYHDVVDFSTVKRDSSRRNYVIGQLNQTTTIGADTLRYYNVYDCKRIPSQYIFCSKQTKFSLLGGLIDSCGFIDRRGVCHLRVNQNQPGLIDTIPILLNSIGLKIRTKDDARSNTRQWSFLIGKDDFVGKIDHQNYQKLRQSITRLNNISRTIVNVERTSVRKVGKCIQVDNRQHIYLAGEMFLPTHNSTIVGAYCLWYAIFHDNKDIVILANKLSTSKEIFSRILMMYEMLPDYVKPGVKEYNKTSMTFENGSKISCAATSASAIRGRSIALCVVDEFAFLPSGIADEFITSTFPALSSSSTSKLVLISTPYGLNHFYKIWHDSELGLNSFVRVEGKWNEARDQQWFDLQAGLLENDKVKIAQELECVDRSTMITLKDNTSGEITTIPIGDAYQILMDHSNNQSSTNEE